MNIFFLFVTLIFFLQIDLSVKTSTPSTSDKPPTASDTLTGAPSVNLLNSVVPQTTMTSSIGVRKIQPKKSGVSLFFCSLLKLKLIYLLY